MNRTNTNGMDIAEYRNIKEMLKTKPVNKRTAAELGRGTTTLATIKKSKSFKQYKELRKAARGKKKTVKQVNITPITIDVKKLGRLQKIAVIRKERLYEDGDMIVVPAALFEALSEQMTELSKELAEVKKLHGAPQMYLETITRDEPLFHVEPTFKERLTAKVVEMKRRWKK